jgi:chromosomal replication initiation ATPase DnaA
MYLCRAHTGFSLPQIGVKFNRDHSTVIYACDKITSEIGLNNTKVITDLARLRHVLGVE